MTPEAATEVFEARPVIEADPHSPWAQAERVRDSFADAVEQLLRTNQMRALVARSQPGIYPVSLQLAAWTPSGGDGGSAVTRRDEVRIEISVNPYLEFPLSYKIIVNARNQNLTKTRWRMSVENVQELASFALLDGKKSEILKGDLRRALLALIPPFNLFLERNRLIKEARPSLLNLPTILMGVGALLAFATYMAAPVLTPVGILLLISGFVVAARTPRLYSAGKRPDIAPRRLFLLDSWHTSVPEIGAHFAQLVARLERAVTSLDPSIVAAWERHEYRTPYSFEARDRLTLTKGQAVVHLHVYPFVNDAFVGWDGYLNWARWAETKPVSQNMRGGKSIEYRSLAVGAHIPTDFDLVELNALCELVHRRIVTELKELLKEKEIEADIDFSIIRGNRDNALTAGKAGAGGRKTGAWRLNGAGAQQRPAAD